MDEAERDALFAVPPAEFVAARQAAATRLKAAGRKDEAKAVAALARPKATAYAVNQLRWRSPELLAAIAAATTQVRAAHESGGGEALRAGLRARREALDAAMRAAEASLRETGQALSLEASRRIRATLDAFAAAPESVDVGRLVEDLAPPGFDSLAGLAVTAPAAPAGSAAPAGPVAPAADSSGTGAESPSPVQWGPRRIETGSAAQPPSSGATAPAALAEAARARQQRRAEAEQRLALRAAEAGAAARERDAATRLCQALDADVAELRARLADRLDKQAAAQARLDLAREREAATQAAVAAARRELPE